MTHPGCCNGWLGCGFEPMPWNGISDGLQMSAASLFVALKVIRYASAVVPVLYETGDQDEQAFMLSLRQLEAEKLIL